MVSQKPHYHGHRARLRERLLKNPAALADYEILELLLAAVLPRQDTKPLAKELLTRHKTIHEVFAAEPSALRKLKGFGPAMEAFWALLLEWRARYDEFPLTMRETLNNPDAVIAMVRSRLDSLTHEELWLLLLDSRNKLIDWKQVSQGTVNEIHFYSRDIFALALEKNAVSLILVHNHPSGSPNPSLSDIESTRNMANGAKLLNMKLMDHIIIMGKNHFSFKANGLLADAHRT